MDNVVVRVWLQGQERSDAMKCKRCKGRCSLWDWVRTPLRWNPLRTSRQPKWFNHSEARYRREREMKTTTLRMRLRAPKDGEG